MQGRLQVSTECFDYGMHCSCVDCSSPTVLLSQKVQYFVAHEARDLAAS